MYWFHSCGVATNIVDDHVVSVCLTGSVWECTSLVFVHGLFHVVWCYQYVVPFLMLVVGFVFNFFLGRSTILVEQTSFIFSLMWTFCVYSDSGKNWWHYWCWWVAKWDNFFVVWLWVTWIFMKNLMLHEGILWLFQCLGVHRRCSWLLVYWSVWPWLFVHSLLQLECLEHNIGDLLIVLHPDCLIAGCKYCGWWCWS